MCNYSPIVNPAPNEVNVNRNVPFKLFLIVHLFCSIRSILITEVSLIGTTLPYGFWIIPQ